MRRVRTDSFVNALTGLGTTRDKRTGAAYCMDAILQPQELDNLFSSNDLAATIVSKLVDDALREGFELKRKEKPGAGKKTKPKAESDPTEPGRKPKTDAADESDPVKDKEDADAIMVRCRELGVRERVYSGAIWGRLFGGGGVILGVTGGGSLTSKLDDTKVKGLEFLIDVDRQDLIPQTWNADGTVETFTWTQITAGGLGNGQPRLVHASRVVLFPGVKTTNRARARNMGWDHSVIQRIYNTLLGVDGMWTSLEHMFGDMSQAVFKLQGFIAAMAEADSADGQATVTTRIQLMDTLRSVARAIVLDAGDETGAGAESFEVVERGALTGVDGILDKAFIRLACAARMPVTVLMGQSPAGMDATGDSDLEIWGNEVQTYRRHVIEPRLERIVNMIAREFGETDPQWTIDWPNLRHTTETEDATLEKMRVDTAIALITAQVALPEEVALSLPKIAPTLGLDLNEDARETALEMALEQMEEPPPEPMAPGTDPSAGVDPVTGEPIAAPAPGESTPPNGKPAAAGAAPAKPSPFGK